jgi:hypothetical protein
MKSPTVWPGTVVTGVTVAAEVVTVVVDVVAGVVIMDVGVAVVLVVDTINAPVVCVICVIIVEGIVVVKAVAVVDVVSDSAFVVADTGGFVCVPDVNVVVPQPARIIDKTIIDINSDTDFFIASLRRIIMILIIWMGCCEQF